MTHCRFIGKDSIVVFDVISFEFTRGVQNDLFDFEGVVFTSIGGILEIKFVHLIRNKIHNITLWNNGSAKVFQVKNCQSCKTFISLTR